MNFIPNNGGFDGLPDEFGNLPPLQDRFQIKQEERPSRIADLQSRMNGVGLSKEENSELVRLLQQEQMAQEQKVRQFQAQQSHQAGVNLSAQNLQQQFKQFQQQQALQQRLVLLNTDASRFTLPLGIQQQQPQQQQQPRTLVQYQQQQPNGGQQQLVRFSQPGTDIGPAAMDTSTQLVMVDPRMSELQQMLNTTNMQLIQLQKDAADEKTARDQISQEKITCEEGLRRTITELEARERRINALENDVEKIRKDCSAMSEVNRELNRTINDVRRDLQDAKSSAVALGTELKEKKTAIVDLERELSTRISRVDATNEVRNLHEAAMALKDADIQTLTRHKQEETTKLEECRAEAKAIRDTSAVYQASLLDLQTRNKALDAEVAKLRDELKKQKPVIDAAPTLASEAVGLRQMLENNTRHAAEEKAKLEATNKQLTEEYQKSKDTIARLRGERNKAVAAQKRVLDKLKGIQTAMVVATEAPKDDIKMAANESDEQKARGAKFVQMLEANWMPTLGEAAQDTSNLTKLTELDIVATIEDALMDKPLLLDEEAMARIWMLLLLLVDGTSRKFTERIANEAKTVNDFLQQVQQQQQQQLQQLPRSGLRTILEETRKSSDVGLRIKVQAMCADRCWAYVAAKYMGKHYHPDYPLADQVLYIMAKKKPVALQERLTALVDAHTKVFAYVMYDHDDGGLGDDEEALRMFLLARARFERLRDSLLSTTNANQPVGVDLNTAQLYEQSLQGQQPLQLYKKIADEPRTGTYWRYNASSLDELVMPLAIGITGGQRMPQSVAGLPQQQPLSRMLEQKNPQMLSLPKPKQQSSGLGLPNYTLFRLGEHDSDDDEVVTQPAKSGLSKKRNKALAAPTDSDEETFNLNPGVAYLRSWRDN